MFVHFAKKLLCFSMIRILQGLSSGLVLVELWIFKFRGDVLCISMIQILQGASSGLVLVVKSDSNLEVM